MIPEISFEFFPPQNIEATFRLHEAVQSLAPLGPRFVSVTYGAGGTTRALTRDAAHALHRTTGLRVAAHLTCVNASREETLEIARDYAKAGVTDIVALRGDAPKGADGFTPHPEGFASSVELIKALKAEGSFHLRVGAYPEQHPDAANAQADIDFLKAKFDAGADEAITQFFFEADTFLRFRDKCAKAGIDGMITPGILPVENWTAARRFAGLCGAHISDELALGFDAASRDGREELFALAHATELCDDLQSEGVERFHFYTLNRPELTRDICVALGVTPSLSLQDVA
ncbi:methylenetetrahydrofolate reductase [NAD(P)H] [Lentibacter algarum]|uniref:methylenetetrahydrofolate reductase [NAD(P)H] n=1 Tax=Lentibacter algarum TaxID=576131 RepID=UPI001C06C77C|nr:methylenetetrahydrofolate reductase [NAD(P)H] [Lentibacter algarum]MBU2981797.1 methylenetetrahydrofolate reductase [NAD(P)H] [Lentibacter algarum]